MSRVSPTLEGLRAAFRRPSLTVAEITWRWIVGATAATLLTFALVEYFSTLPVSNGDLLLLRSGQPVLVGQAISHIVRGSMGRALIAATLGALALTYLWILAASLGRVATVRGLRDYFADHYFADRHFANHHVADHPLYLSDDRNAPVSSSPQNQSHPTTPESSPLRALLGLNFLRAALVLAAALGFAGAAILAGFVSTDSNPRPGLAFLLFLPLAGLICLTTAALNWILSLAGIFAVRERVNALGALSAAVGFFRERMGPVAAVSVWFGLIHFAVFFGATSVISVPLGFAAIVPVRLVILAMLLLTLAYFALVDCLYLARLAGYVCILEMPEHLLAPPQYFAPQVSPPSNPPPQTIDRDEPILSDLSQ